MNYFLNKTLPLFILLFTISFAGKAQHGPKEFYQLKTYIIKNEKQERTVDTYLENAFLPTLKRYGIKNIGVFKIIPNKYKKSDKIYVLIPFASLSQFEELEQYLITDKMHQTDGAVYLEAQYNDPPYERINSILMRSFIEMPKLQPSAVTGVRDQRVYELRSYESPTEATYKNKVDMFNAGGEVQLFSDLGFNAVFYAEVISGDQMPNLMYMTTFENMAERDSKWNAFSSSDKWTSLKAEEKYQNNMNKAAIMLLYPTEYSDY
ncbi:NIPSNAP family protein [Maribacter sp. 2210JD10-5]|uniref:NIPSNAP family protein n=1 Tax=Maribacter sp. 2210JD10-5 TaxID=3386272 RepID=UPI0039BC844D